MKCLILIGIILLVSCSKSEPVKINESQRQYVGVWQFTHETKTKNNLNIKKILLAINLDSTAFYRHCIVTKNANQGGIFVPNSRTSSKTTLPSAIITELTDNKITLEQQIDVISFDYDLTITRPPYYENGRWYLGIDNAILEKLEGSDIKQLTMWECPDIDKDLEGKSESQAFESADTKPDTIKYVMSAEEQAIVDKYIQICKNIEQHLSKIEQNTTDIRALEIKANYSNANSKILLDKLRILSKYLSLSCKDHENIQETVAGIGSSASDYGRTLEKIIRAHPNKSKHDRKLISAYLDIAKHISSFSDDFVTILEAAPDYIVIMNNKKRVERITNNEGKLL